MAIERVDPAAHLGFQGIIAPEHKLDFYEGIARHFLRSELHRLGVFSVDPNNLQDDVVPVRFRSVLTEAKLNRRAGPKKLIGTFAEQRNVEVATFDSHLALIDKLRREYEDILADADELQPHELYNMAYGSEPLTTTQAAKVMRVSLNTIIRLFDNKVLKGFKIPNSRFRRIPPQNLRRCMEEEDIPIDHLIPATVHVEPEVSAQDENSVFHCAGSAKLAEIFRSQVVGKIVIATDADLDFFEKFDDIGDQRNLELALRVFCLRNGFPAPDIFAENPAHQAAAAFEEPIGMQRTETVAAQSSA